MSNPTYTTLFLDVGGVILTNGWERQSRESAAKKFNIDYNEMNERHRLAFDTYELGHMTLDEYLHYTVFYQSRNFTPQQFKDFMFAQSKPFQDMLDLMKEIKTKYHLKVVAVSNEGKELVHHRIKTFKLDELFDIFIFSGFIQLRKPDLQFYRLAIDLSQAHSQQVIYIDDRPLLVEIGRKMGFRSICHTNTAATKDLLEELLK